jgi:hypothetical protein
VPYFERFSRKQILVLKFEDIIAKSADLVGQLHRFLGVPPREADADGIGVINPSENDVGCVPEDLRRQLAQRYADANRRLASMLGHEFELWA